DRSPRRSRWLRRPLFDDARVLEAMQEHADGYVELEDADGTVDLAIWSHMGGLGWTYVVRGPRELLMP
ncbi:MAG: hypothetical protein KC656_17685, partial [Myxococcales bacterium]|nr:hypothetical protein [Myxococcales bacterium]